MPTVLVTDAGRGSAVAIIRSLGRQGWSVVAAASDRLAPGSHSRYTSAAVRYPDPVFDPDGAIGALADAAARHAVDLLIPVTDEIILPLSVARDRLPSHCRVAMADAEALESVVDKLATVALARSLDVAVPDTVAVETAEQAVREAGPLGWPIVVKPRRSYDWRPGHAPTRRWVSYARDETELHLAVEATAGVGALLQRFHLGTGRAVSLLAHKGTPIAAFQHLRLREMPPSGGASALRESEVLDDELYGAAARMLAALRWTGLAMVEFKTSDAGSQLMEINGRVWGALPLAVASGMDFPARLADLHLCGPPPAGQPVATDYAEGVRSRDLDLERAWISEVLRGRPPAVGTLPPRRAAVGVSLRLLSPRDGYDVLCWSDPVPGLIDLAKVISKPVRERYAGRLGGCRR
ncbi:MAG TPA: ATP-grasp domain-containing protein [Acidimicrobiales bacterium]|nr:ATP-grasp domain-containing protein [Acidimicrobiales bacterium]